jgi:hypothetical protein
MLTYDDAEAPAIEAVAEHTVDCGRGSPAAAPSRGDQMTTTRAGNGSVEPAMRLDELVAVAASIEARRHPGRVMGALQGPTGQRAVLGVGHEWLPDGPVPTSDTLFEIGSITRVFTGLLLAIAVVRNEVTLDTPVNALLPGRVAVPSRDGVQITLEHLATHRSGLPPHRSGCSPRVGPSSFRERIRTRSGRPNECSRRSRRPGCDALQAAAASSTPTWEPACSDSPSWPRPARAATASSSEARRLSRCRICAGSIRSSLAWARRAYRPLDYGGDA